MSLLIKTKHLGIAAVAFAALGFAGAAQATHLAWTPPTMRVNGSALLPNEIARYNVYAVPSKALLGSATITRLRLPCYAGGVAITAVDTQGLESDLSNIVAIDAYNTDGTTLERLQCRIERLMRITIPSRHSQ